jgi:crotonobetainyl-CoA:carnitine CoA-transferase CaiB-like acyl-CoA transferase
MIETDAKDRPSLKRQDESTFRPLVSYRVVELSTSPAGLYAGALLADLGADVWRVQTPWAGYVRPEAAQAFEEFLNGAKKTLPISDLAEHLAAHRPHRIIVDMRTGGALLASERAMLDEALGQLPVGVGQALMTEYDPSFAASTPGASIVSGATAAASWSIGRPDREPLCLPCDYSDLVAGIHLAAAMIADFARADDRDTAQVVRVAATDVMAYLVSMIGSNFVPYGRAWRRDGPRITESGGCYPGAIFPASDGDVSIVCRQPKEWQALVEAMGRPAWSEDVRFQDPRVIARSHTDEADAFLRPWIADHTCAELQVLGQRHGFPVAPIRRAEENLDEPQFLERNFFTDLKAAGNLRLKVPGRPYQVTSIAPPRAADTGAVRLISGWDRPERRPGRTKKASKPLAGLRVLDLTWVWSGPMVTSVLADLGSEVIKIESRKHPDPVRIRGRAVRDGVPVAGPDIEVSPFFNQLGHNKRSVEVDLASEEGRSQIRALAGQCDVLVENMRPGVLARHRLGFKDLAEINPRLVYVSMSAMGSAGPRSQMMGYGVVMSGFAGLEQLVGYPDQTVGEFNLAMSDATAASHALLVLLAAVRQQREHGTGAWIDLSQVEATIALLAEPLLEAQLCGEAQIPGNGHPVFTPHGVFQALGTDQWIAVAVQSEDQRESLARLLGTTGSPARASTNLTEGLREWARGHGKHAGAQILRDHGIPAAPVNSYEELNNSDWFVNGGYTARLQHPYLDGQLVVGAPWWFDDVANAPTAAAPLLGEANSEIFATDAHTDG